jgi:integrase/recombinase XerD
VRVQRVVMPVTGAESWTVADDGWTPVVAAERYLAHLAGIERSPNTVRAYAHGLRLWFEFLGLRGLAWDSAGVEHVSRFVAWLRAPADNVIVLDDTAAVRSEATVNRHLAALFGSTTSTPAPAWTSPPIWWRGGGWRGVPTSRSCITSPAAGRSQHGQSSCGCLADCRRPCPSMT